VGCLVRTLGTSSVGSPFCTVIPEIFLFPSYSWCRGQKEVTENVSFCVPVESAGNLHTLKDIKFKNCDREPLAPLEVLAQFHGFPS
jgi:hypothetical protein